MAYWGVAEAVGPNYNDPASADRFQQAHEAIQKASDLSGGASRVESAYIAAMAKRLPADPNANCGKQLRRTAMPCAMWSKPISTISMPPLCSPSQE
jgi:hypothetical protein